MKTGGTGFGRRTWVVLVAVLLVGLPAGALRAVCAGSSCKKEASVTSEVPFCSLPASLRDHLSAGFRTGRSPDILTVTGRSLVVADSTPTPEFWPSRVAPSAADLPMIFSGTGIAPGTELPAGVTLDQIAPTIARVIGLHRAHPDVRSGKAIDGVATGTSPRLVLEVVWIGSTSAESKEMPFQSQLGLQGASTTQAAPGSIPLDPAALLTTIGTGGLPYQHGITGSLIRNDVGRIVPPWSPAAPVSVIATLADDLDHTTKQEARIGLVAPDPADRGLIGGDWYLGSDRDEVRIARKPPAVTAAADRVLQSGFGRDSVPDVLGVVLSGSPQQLDNALKELVQAARRASKDSVAIVVTSIGQQRPSDSGQVTSAGAIERQIDRSVPAPGPVIAATADGGFFLDQGVLAKNKISEDRILAAVEGLKGPQDETLMSDVFPAIAVEFKRYC